MQTETATLADTARKALDEHEAALAAKAQEALQQRAGDAEQAVQAALEQLGVRDYETEHLEHDPAGGFSATVLAGGLALMVQRRDRNAPCNLSIVAACPDCQEHREYGSHIRHLHELGAALRSSEQPCHECQRDPHTVRREPAWRIDRFADENEAAETAEKWENAGYEIRLYHGGDTIVVAGHKYQPDTF